jgi:hypothetical protein
MVLSGCAKSADDVVSAYQSPMLYANWTCGQIAAEQGEVRGRVVALAQKQDGAATRDAVAMGVGLILFWPALFVLAAGDDEGELASLKGRDEALRSAAAAKGCTSAPMVASASAPMVASVSASSFAAPVLPSDGRLNEGAAYAAFSADDIQGFCAQSWETRRASDGRTEYNPCHRRDAFN